MRRETSTLLAAVGSAILISSAAAHAGAPDEDARVRSMRLAFETGIIPEATLFEKNGVWECQELTAIRGDDGKARERRVSARRLRENFQPARAGWVGRVFPERANEADQVLRVSSKGEVIIEYLLPTIFPETFSAVSDSARGALAYTVCREAPKAVAQKLPAPSAPLSPLALGAKQTPGGAPQTQ